MGYSIPTAEAADEHRGALRIFVIPAQEKAVYFTRKQASRQLQTAQTVLTSSKHVVDTKLPGT